ncbi:MAG: YeeE/YedE thiosulfate transporter family protein [Sphingomonadaceae bacterium]
MAQAVATSLLALCISFAVGFAIRRGSTCMVEATRQWVVDGRSRRMRALVVAGTSSGCIILPLAWLLPNSAHLAPSYPVMAVPLLAGAIFGLGARINGGCAFGTLARLAGGDLSMLGTVLGSLLGALAGASFGSRPAIEPAPFAEPGWLAGGALVLSGAIAVATIRRRHLANILRALRHRKARLGPLPAMLVIGVLGGVLYAIAGSWTLFSVLGKEGTLAAGLTMEGAEAKALLGAAALVTGAVAAAIRSGQFRIIWPGGRPLLSGLAGGAMMGVAAGIIPGSNGSLLVFAMPSGALHAWLAFAAMVGVLALSFLPATRKKKRRRKKH